MKTGFTIKDVCFGLGISRSRYYEVLSKRSGGNSKVKQIGKNKEGKLSQSNREIFKRLKDHKSGASLMGL